VCSKSCTCTANPYCGDGKLDSGEKCEQGNPAGVSCTWDKCNQSACTCLPAGLVILKSGIEQCINEGTTSVSSTITYTISIKNNGEGDGKITKVEDTLDNKVVSSNLTPKDISDGGKYSNGKITWTFTSPLVIEAGKEKLLTYKLDVNKENFGIYNNSVVVFPEVGPATQPVTAQVTVDCKANEPVPDVPVQPQTGLFDDSRNIVIMGAILLFVGLGWSWITESLITVRGKMLENNRSRFEKRISKR
ncbi:MAG TPA: Ig-like domain-containing protein, partial [Candidatus Dojkabacteria bacterium]|nr:Ig-like domain-containing protein [Candidatus Dojkabacteria bacterium]